ncbi:MAG: TIGR03560 family F420-dependent LLM class oxidoreductase [Deltaproteobacteria bacterium]|nr:MAG: TIGR03560 family F420-dependent LLM class oxidoreductase [Deltaproteobacteria bacterium]
MTKPIHFGVALPQIKRTWEEVKATATELDRLGFDSVWVADHLYGIPMPNLPIFEAWSELAAVAAVTERVQLGTLVTPPYFRNTGVLAKQIATIDNIAGGRTICGLGAGWFATEFEAYGLEFPSIGRRLRALEEMAEALVRLWTEPSVTFEGEYVRLSDAMCEPKPPRRPPILIGGGGERVLLRIAAERADIWNNLAVAQKDLAHKIKVLHEHCREVGRSPEEIQISQQTLVVLFESDAEARDALGKAEQIYGGHLGSGIEQHGIWGGPERVIGRIREHVELGCTMFVIEFFGRDPRVPARLFADRVLPSFR